MVNLDLFAELMIFLIGFGIGFLIAMGIAIKIIADKHDLQNKANKLKEQCEFYSYLIASNNIPMNVVRQYEEDRDYFQPL